MNKGITLLIMLVILGAMGLVFFFHVSAERDGATARKSDMPTAVSVRKPDAAGNPPTDLIRIDPPMSSLDPPAGSRPDGSPGPVRLVAGASPAQAEARARTSAREGETSAAAPARQMPQGQQGQGQQPQGQQGQGQQPQGQQPQGQQGQAQQGQTRQTQPEGASGIRPAGRQTYPPSLTPWETSAASSPAARTTESQGAYVAPVFPEPAEPQRPASAPAAPQSRPDASSAAQPAAPQSRAVTPAAPPSRPDATSATQPAAPQSRTDALAASLSRTDASPVTPGRADAAAAQRPAPSEAPPAADASGRPRSGVPENTAGRTRPLQPASGRAAQNPEQSYKSTHTLTNISLTFAGNEMRLLLEADGAFPCKTFALSGPDRLVIDLPGAWKGMKAPTVPGNRIVRKARVGLQSNSARLVLDLNSPLKNHKVEQRGNMVEILVQ